jgi:hypothetical protein
MVESVRRRKSVTKITPEDIITLDLLIYTKGDEDDVETWDKIKREIKTLAHRNLFYGNEQDRRNTK